MKKTSPQVISQVRYDSENEEGQLALDVFQTKDNIVILAPIAGVKLEDMTVQVADDVLTIKGNRHLEVNVNPEDYFTQECFWGDFSRSIVLPASVDSNKISAHFKDGVLKIEIPKIEKVRSKVIRIKTS
ncbi:Hsp20/alpha crystallin family protein [Candidatus Peregrinibacteria bacterium]|nr:Hsp20/alpha crystallin family protein [Candidatus Peregrinibacteria bacterium]